MEQGADADGYMGLTRLLLKFVLCKFLARVYDRLIFFRHQESAGAIPWIKPLHTILPSAKDISRFHQFAKESVLARKAKGSTRKDLFYHLVSAMCI